MNPFNRRWAEGEDGLREMCDEGIVLLGRHNFDALRFDCFNKAETDFVTSYMCENHPCVPFFTTSIAR
jgi:hypothetical protein